MLRQNGVSICGFYGNYNLGDEAMLAGMINLLGECQKNLFFTVFSGDPQDSKLRHSVYSIHLQKRKHSFERLVEVMRNPVFILGGGDLLRDSDQSSIALTWLRPLQQAIRLHRRTLVLGISVGEISRPETKLAIPKTLNRVDFISVRDEQSKFKLEELGVQKKIYVTSDLALETIPKLISLQAPIKQNIQIGVSVRHLTGRGSSLDVKQYPKILQELAVALNCLVEKYGATIHLLPLRTQKDTCHPLDDDYVSSLELLRYTNNPSKFVVHRYFDSLHQFNQLVSSLDLLIGMRLHSLILASGLGVPVIAAEYDSKVKGFMEEIGQSSHSISLSQFDAQSLLLLAEKILENPSPYREELRIGVTQYRQRSVIVKDHLKKVIC